MEFVKRYWTLSLVLHRRRVWLSWKHVGGFNLRRRVLLRPFVRRAELAAGRARMRRERVFNFYVCF